MLGARIGLAVVTEIYTVAVSHRYLPAEPEVPKTLGARVAIPLRLAAGIFVGFGTGYIVGAAQDRAQAHDGPPAGGGPGAGRRARPRRRPGCRGPLHGRPDGRRDPPADRWLLTWTTLAKLSLAPATGRIPAWPSPGP